MNVPYINLPEQHRGLRARILEAVARVLEHGQFILGPEVRQLEERLAAWLGIEHVVTVGSGTDALVLALRLRGIGPGDEVVTVSHSFVATASAIRLVGASPVFVDIDERTMLMDPGLLERACSPRTRAVMPVHLNGFPCDMDPIVEFCDRHGLALIEDCAQAMGARYRGRSVGSFGIGCFSLHPLKALSACGDGGFLAVRDDGDALRLGQLRNLGLVDRDHCGWVAGNSRLDTLQAAILLVKLDCLAGWIEARRRHAATYRSTLTGKVRLPPDGREQEPTYSAFVIRHAARDRLAAEMRCRGIDVKIHYPLAIHQQRPFTSFARFPLPVTEQIVTQILSLPVTPELTLDQQAAVLRAVDESLAALGREADETEVLPA